MVVPYAEASYSARRFGNMPFTPQWGPTDSCRMDNSRVCRDMMSNIFTPADNEFFNEGVRNEFAIKWSWKLLCQSAQQHANTLLRFEAMTEEHANLVYTHESCKDVKARYKEWKDMRLSGNGEMVRRKIINVFVRWLHQIAEYKRSLGEAFSLAIDEISIGRKDRDIQDILTATPNVYLASSDIFMETYENLFDNRYSYVDKVARAYRLDPSGLQNVMPNETGPTPGGGSRYTPTASYA
nr:hypothetical protein [Tanacetum cinerariifolium]